MPLPWEEVIRRAKAFESFRPKAYSDFPRGSAGGQYSVGYGTRARSPDETIDEPEAARRLGGELEQSRAAVSARFPNLNENQLGAATLLHMNAGGKFMGAGLGRAIDSNDIDEIRRRWLQYTSPDPRYQKGLENRRRQELALFQGGQGGPAGPLPQAPLGAGLPGTPPIVPMGREAFMAQNPPMGMGGGASGFPGIPPGMPPPQFPAPQPVAEPQAEIPGDMGGGQPPPEPPPDPFAQPTVRGGAGWGGAPTQLQPGQQPQPDYTTESKQVPATDTTAATDPVKQQSGGMAPKITGGGLWDYFNKSGPYANPENQGGMGFLGALSTGLTGPLGSMGLQLLAPGTKAVEASHNAAMERLGIARQKLAERQDTRQELTFQREQKNLAARDAAYAKTFPGGVADPSSPLLKGLTPSATGVLGGMGAEKAMDWLYSYQLKDAEGRADMARKLELRKAIDDEMDAAPGAGGTGGQAPATPTPAVAPPSFGGAAIGGGAAVPSLGGTAPSFPPGFTGAPPAALPGPAPGPQAAAPAGGALAQAAPTDTGARMLPEPVVQMGNRSFTVPQARERARRYRAYGLSGDADEYDKAIASAEKEGGVPPEIKTQAIKTDQAFADMSKALDRYNAIIQKHKGTHFTGLQQNTVDQAVAEGERNNIILLAKDLYSLGQLSASDLKLALSIEDPVINFVPMTGGSGFNYPGYGLADRTQAAVDAMKVRITETRNIKGAAAKMPPVPVPTTPQSPAAAKAEPKGDIVTGPNGKKWRRRGPNDYVEVE